MSTVVALGTPASVEGCALAGCTVMAATGEAEVLAAWKDLPPDAGLLILAPDAERILRLLLHERPRLLWTVLP